MISRECDGVTLWENTRTLMVAAALRSRVIPDLFVIACSVTKDLDRRTRLPIHARVLIRWPLRPNPQSPEMTIYVGIANGNSGRLPSVSCSIVFYVNDS
jgi:hypothetical protein